MSDPQLPSLETLDVPGGSAGEHRALVTGRPLVVAATGDDGLNTIRRALQPLRCWALEDVRFHFDSSFLSVDGRREFARLDQELTRGALRVALFGHADPTGDDAYNKILSGRRAQAVYALLRRDLDAWETLYQQPFGGDNWRQMAVREMLLAAGFDPGSQAAVQDFQASRGLAVDGVAGPNTRRELFALYMDFVCVDGHGQPYTLGDEDFLGRGAESDGAIDVQGCTEFNPIYLMSQTQAQVLAQDREARNAENAPNRRVVGFLFDAAIELRRAQWPCPSLSEGSGGCRASFWPDGDARRQFGESAREHAKGGGTMACAFYDRLARFSPCEAKRGRLRLRLVDAQLGPIPSAEYTIEVSGRVLRRGVASEGGILTEPSLPIGPRMVVRFGERHPEADASILLPHRTEVVLGLTGDTSLDADFQRLHNLGYPDARNNPGRIAAFQVAVGIEPADGEFDEQTRQAVRDAHDSI